ncbi:MAG: 50S ribosome-binding protein YggL [Dehalococcoidia bacterium]|nr:50S ribosome-binding protein YggL [Dehalococcoidia bacterium]
MIKKQLRKKKHLGEFREWGRQVVITLNSSEVLDQFLDDLVIEAVEANGLYCGGGGRANEIDLVVELGRLTDDPEARFRMVTAWLDARPDVVAYKADRLFDLWHEDVEDMEGAHEA